MQLTYFTKTLILAIMVILFTSCNGDKTEDPIIGENITYTIEGISANTEVMSGNSVGINIAIEGDEATSVVLLIDETELETFTTFPIDYTLSTNGLEVGDHNFKVVVYVNTTKAKEESISFKITELVVVTLTDYDGNEYATVQIGDQLWMAENLKVTHYRNGDAIDEVTDDQSWQDQLTGARCNYKNEADYSTSYGYLYNQFAITDTRGLCPAGWHVPTRDEMDKLISYLGGKSKAGSKLKESGIIHWSNPLTTVVNDATNETGFTALPGGSRNASAQFTGLGYIGYLWTQDTYISSLSGKNYGYCYTIGLNENTISDAMNYYSYLGMSVRCIKD